LKTTIVTLLITFLAIYGCAEKGSDDLNNDEKPTAGYQRITPEQAKEMLDNNEDIILLDVRTEDEFKEKRIPGAILLPDFMITDSASEVLPDKNAIILIYCRSGRRSENAARELIDMGYKNVYDFGGIIDWEFETESG